ncbi:hypothetical protein SAMN04487955_105175 [Halomonas korlensis]|uniref:Uncharacterized protein n=1 Tax=Halomonas korlensis TaxID=463301 RepID=A0A1I7HXN9_9GAMM|nr:hypothetical protein SAMN04487955_105175 [Halomonas korlensis]
MSVTWPPALRVSIEGVGSGSLAGFGVSRFDNDGLHDAILCKKCIGNKAVICTIFHSYVVMQDIGDLPGSRAECNILFHLLDALKLLFGNISLIKLPEYIIFFDIVLLDRDFNTVFRKNNFIPWNGNVPVTAIPHAPDFSNDADNLVLLVKKDILDIAYLGSLSAEYLRFQHFFSPEASLFIDRRVTPFINRSNISVV